MRLSASTRCRLAGWLIATLLFMQFATLAYACPGSAVVPGMPAAMTMPDCAGMTAPDPEQPQLCKAHCEAGTQTVNTAPGVDILSLAVLPWVLDRGGLCELPCALSVRAASAPTGPPLGTPPVYLSFLVLRN
ncbi:hypothetical protein M8A51_12605 [Schlegelella sp. S2-27]|uniref:Uncharacterized protein n=1 Tax=Caldimonas mangrovi TaxID=2944811 RepID=A0ABT0YQG2_9BURK|nr:hypothetical protein [Caldimonas mangrovi]MCM5680371.1 hypothetical protein [Caldimonas mangrovi]